MNHTVNGAALNGFAAPSWVVRAIASSVAAAVLATTTPTRVTYASVAAPADAGAVAATPTRVTYASSFGDAAVVVSLSQTHTIQAFASGTGGVAFGALPTVRRAADSAAVSGAFGLAAVVRSVSASASAGASCSGEAIPASVLGDADAAATAAAYAGAHIVHPGASVLLSAASAGATGDVTRYAGSSGLAAGGLARGEASVRRAGNSYFEHDGYSAENGVAVGVVEADKTKLTLTFGAFDYGNSSAFGVNSHIQFSASSLGLASVYVIAASPTLVHGALSFDSALCAGLAEGARVVLPSVSAGSSAEALYARPVIDYKAFSVGVAEASPQSALGFRAVPAATLASGTAELLSSAYAEQRWGQLYADAAAESFSVYANCIFAGSVADAFAVAVVESVLPTQIHAGLVGESLGTSLVGRADAVANSEIPAPRERSAAVDVQVRAMAVPGELRMMVAL